MRAHGVAYINSDGNGRGYLEIEGSHTLEKFSNDIAHEFPDPETKLSAWKRQQLREISKAKTPEQREEIRKRSDLRIPRSAPAQTTPHFSSTTACLVNIGFGGEDDGGIYPLHLRRFLLVTRISAIRILSTGARSRRPARPAVMRLADATASFSSAILRTRQAYLKS